MKFRLLLCAALLALAAPASAALWGGAAASDGWDIAITPYGFSSDLDADVKIGGQDQSFKRDDPTDLVTYGFRLRTEAWKGKLGILTNVNYFDMWDETQLGSASTVELAGDLFTIEGALSWRFLQNDFNGADLGCEVFGGGRAAILDMNLRQSPGSTQNAYKDWVEPLIGGRIILGLGERWNFVVKGDVGGFGVGSGSDMSWNVNPEVVFLFTEGLYFQAGYEIMDIKTEDVPNGNQLDAQSTGPTIGLTFRFSPQQ